MEAFALDPADPMRDARHEAWFASLDAGEQASTIGLRVRWLWTYDQMRQAPDTAEFRLYRSAGQANNFKGRITAAASQGADHARVETDLGNTEAASAWTGAILRADERSYTVTDSEAGAPLVLIVERTGVDKVVPPGDAACSLALPGGVNTAHPLARDMGRALSWEERIWTVGIDDHVAEGLPRLSERGETGPDVAAIEFAL